jgi:CubicO group peptidase (beta-lactamase class C family)
MNKLTASGRNLHRLGLVTFCVWCFCAGILSVAWAETNAVTIPPRADLARDLVFASLDGDNQKISLLLSNSIDVNARTGPGLTAWRAANITGHADSMDLLVKRGSDTNVVIPKPELILDWYVNQKITAESPGLALAVIRDGDVVFKKGWGLANLEYDIPVTPATVFHVASVSKQFTAFAITRLIQQGKLSLDDDVRKYLPEMHDFGTKITLRNLLFHTSGLNNQWTLLVLAGERNGDVVTQSDIMKLLENQTELRFKPGEKFEYCNSGYTLLSEVVAKVSGKSFVDFSRDEIFEPLGMTNSHFHTNSLEIVKNMAYSYYPSVGGGYHKNILNYETVGATGLYTTVEDLAKWIANFQNPRAGDAVPLAMMQESGRLNSGKKTGYGMGLFIEEFRGARLIQHGGADASYRSFVLWFPDLRLGVALVSNLGSINSREIALTAAEIYLGDQLQPLKPTEPDIEIPSVQLSPAELDRYVGKYEFYDGSFIREIYRVGNHLESRENNDPASVLAAKGNNRFDAGEGWMVFQDKASGVALQFTNNWGEVFDRISSPKESQPDLSAYVGDYWSAELETFLKIHLRDGQLVLELHRHGDFPLRYVTRNIFATASSEYWWFEVKFQRDSKETVTGLRLNTLHFKRHPLN